MATLMVVEGEKLQSSPLRNREVRDGGLDAREEFGSVVMGREEVEGQVLGAHQMLKHGEHCGHGAVEVVGVEDYGYVNGDGGRRVAVLAVV